MDRLVNYGGESWNPSTSNSDYGRGVLASMRKGQGQFVPSNFNPAAGNYYFPQQMVPTSSAGSGEHVHSPNCPHFATGTQRYTGNVGSSYQSPSQTAGRGSGVVNSTDHIEVLHGDAAMAYLAQQNGGHPQCTTNYYNPDQGNVSETGNHVGMATPFQTETAEGDGGSGVAGATREAEASGAANVSRRGVHGGGGEDFVKINGLPMSRNPRWRQAHPSMPHVYSSVVPFSKANNPTAFKLCGKCPKCKTMKDPSTVRPSVANFKEEGLTPSGSRRFSLPRGIKTPKESVQQQQHGQPISLPIQGTVMTSQGHTAAVTPAFAVDAGNTQGH